MRSLFSQRLLGLLLFFSLLLFGCVTTPEQSEEEEKWSMPIWPKPPDQPRYMHEFTLRRATDIEPRKTSSALTGETANEQVVFAKPMRVAASGGRIYVTDSLINRIHCFDIPRRRFFQFGFRFEGAIKKPTGIAVDKEGFVYVSDSADHRVIVYDSFGMFHRSLGNADILERPVAVTVSPDGEEIYVVDSKGVGSLIHRIVVLNKDGEVIRTIGRRGNQPGEFNMPNDISLGPDGNLYVLDAGNFRVQVLTRTGKPLRHWGSNGNGLGQFARPRDMVVDKDGLIYVADAMFGNIQIFDNEGRLLLPLMERDMSDLPGKFGLMAGIAVDETKRIYVLDQYFKKMEIFRPLSDKEGKEILAGTSPLLKLLEKPASRR
ncbi:MAG: hypothetical protein G8345_04895 [Magnetococcales bacterium]|nr:hypothetical protein [Magnetococcales bacterium]NGZ26208.1 hypothetical protein [Magnetococcales bacterium]